MQKRDVTYITQFVPAFRRHSLPPVFHRGEAMATPRLPPPKPIMADLTCNYYFKETKKSLILYY